MFQLHTLHVGLSVGEKLKLTKDTQARAPFLKKEENRDSYLHVHFTIICFVFVHCDATSLTLNIGSHIAHGFKCARKNLNYKGRMLAQVCALFLKKKKEQ